MRIFKNKAFSKWAAKEGLQDHALSSAVNEMQNGLVDADLGGNVFKKRVALGSQGKSGGVRSCWLIKGMIRPFLFMASPRITDLILSSMS